MLVPLTCGNCGRQSEIEKTSETNAVACPECGADVVAPVGVTIGCTIGHGYRLDRKVDETTQGETYVATQLTMLREVLVKVLSPALVHDDEAFARFAQERKLTARLNHPHILSAIDSGEDAGVYFLVTEYKPGVKLSDYLIAHGNRLDEKAAARIMIPIAEALDHAWSTQRILHRNLKPDNILVSAEGVSFLMNLGIAKSLEDDQTNVTGTEFTVGTPAYMSPEQAQAAAEIDFRADMYSLGVVFYQCVTGAVPFIDPNPVAVMTKHLEEEPVPAHEANDDVSEACSELIARMLAKSPADRPGSWDEVISGMKALSRKSNKTKPPRNITALKAVQKEVKRASLEQRATPEVDPKPSGGNGLKIALLCAILTLCLILAIAIVKKEKGASATHPHPQPQTQIPQTQTTETSPQDAMPESANQSVTAMSPTVKQSYDAAVAFYDDNPEEFVTAIKRFEKIAAVAAGSPGEQLALDMITRIKADQEVRKQEILTELEARAKAKMVQGQVEEGLDILKNYSGPMAEETTRQRWQIVSKLTQSPPVPAAPVEKPEERDPAQVRTELNQGLAHILTAFRDAKGSEALIIAESLVQDAAMCDIEPRLRNLHALAKAFADIDAALLTVVNDMTGKAMKLWDSDGKTINLRFKGTEGNVILAERLIVENGKIKGSVLVRLAPSQLHIKGKIKIFKASSLPYGESLAALLAWQSGHTDYAISTLEESREPTAALVLTGLTAK